MNKFYIIKRIPKEYDDQIYKQFFLKLKHNTNLSLPSIMIPYEEVDDVAKATLFTYEEQAEFVLCSKSLITDPNCFYQIYPVYVSERRTDITVYTN